MFGRATLGSRFHRASSRFPPAGAVVTVMLPAQLYHNRNLRQMELKYLKLKPPVVQIALDFATIEEALAVAKIGVEAGVDWLEIGTPLIVSQGLRPISEMAKAFPNYPVLADYKTMDSGGKNVHRTKAHGGHIMTVCANSPDETVQAAIAAGKETGIWVIADTIGVKNQAARAKQCEQWGVDMIYLHYGADERVADPS